MSVWEAWWQYGEETISLHASLASAEKRLAERCNYDHTDKDRMGYSEKPHKWPAGNNHFCGITKREVEP